MKLRFGERLNSPDIKKLHRIDENEEPLEPIDLGKAGDWYSLLNLPGNDNYYDDDDYSPLDISAVPQWHHIDLADRLIENRHGHRLAKSLPRFYGVDPIAIAHKLVDSDQGSAVVEHLDNFPGFDPVEVVDELIKTNQGYSVARNLGRFKDINRSEIAQKLIDSDQAYAVAQNIANFHDLDKNIAVELIRAKEGFAVVEHLDYFHGFDPVEIVDELINTHQGEAVARSLNRFKGLSHGEVAQKLIDTDQSESLARHLKNFTGLNHSDVAQGLIKAGQEHYLLGSLENFNGLDHTAIANQLIELDKGNLVATAIHRLRGVNNLEIAQKLISKGQVKPLAEHLRQFRDLDRDTAYTLIGTGYAKEVVLNFDVFTNLSSAEIANNLLDIGEGAVVAKHLSSFKRSLDAKLAIKLIDLGHSQAVADGLSNFPALDNDVAYKLLHAGKGGAVLQSSKFKLGVSDCNVIAQKLVETGKASAVIWAISLAGLKNLDATTATKLIGAGEATCVLEHPSSFAGLDYSKIANDLIDSGQGTLVARYLSKSKGLDSSVANKLISNGEMGAVVGNLRSFRDLDETIATRLIDAGMGSAVVTRLSCFTGLNLPEVANRLFDTKQGPVVADNLSTFTNLEHTWIAQKLIDAGQTEAVKRNLKMLNGFRELSVDIANSLIGAGYGVEVAGGLGCFENLDKSIASRLVQIGQGSIVASRVELFQDIDRSELANELIEIRQGEAVLSNLSSFPNLDRADLVRRLADTGQFKAIATHLQKFKDLDKDLADKLITAGEGASVANNLSSFQDIDPEKILVSLIEAHQGAAVAQNPKNFPSHSGSDIATRLINVGDTRLVAFYLSKFSDLDATIASKLVVEGHGQEIEKFITSFGTLTAEIANGFIDRKKGNIVALHLSRFKGVNQAEIAKKLIDSGQGLSVATYLINFTELSPVDIARKLIEAGQVESLMSGIANFNGLDSDIAVRLIDAGYASRVVNSWGCFEKLNDVVAVKLIEAGKITVVVENAHRFSNLSKVPFLGDIYKLQPPSNNAENDPWRLHLLPLLARAGDIRDQDVQHAVVKYIKTFGLVYVADLYDVFRGVMIEGEIGEDVKTELRSFGINPNMQRDAVLQELDKVAKGYTKDILAGSVPESLTTSLGKALFRKEFVPQSSWDRGFDNWYEMGNRSLENYQIPSFLKTQVVDLVEKEEVTELGAEELEAQRRNVLENKDTGTRIATFKSIITDALKGFTLSQVQVAIATRVERQKALIATKDPSTQEKVIESIQKAVDRDEELIEVLHGLDANEGIAELEFRDIPLLYQEMTILLAERNGKEENLSRWLRAFAMKQIIRKNPGLWEVFNTILTKEAIDVDTLRQLADFTSHIIEHEYFDNQEPDLSDVVKNTLRKLLMADKIHKAAGSKEDTDYFTKVLKDLEKIDNPTGNARVTTVQFVPVAGLGRLTAGNVGNACYTSQTESLVDGEFSDTHMMMIVKPREGGTEHIVGSILGIEAVESNDSETPVYIMRANNPQENFLSTIDIDTYVAASVKALIQQAVDLRNENVRTHYHEGKGGNIKVVIPMESSSNASMTNRPRVHERLFKMFKECERTPLKSTSDTNFNGYPIYSRSVCIFEIKDGKEYYYGNHAETPAHKLLP